MARPTCQWRRLPCLKSPAERRPTRLHCNRVLSSAGTPPPPPCASLPDPPSASSTWRTIPDPPLLLHLLTGIKAPSSPLSPFSPPWPLLHSASEHNAPPFTTPCASHPSPVTKARRRRLCLPGEHCPQPSFCRFARCLRSPFNPPALCYRTPPSSTTGARPSSPPIAIFDPSRRPATLVGTLVVSPCLAPPRCCPQALREDLAVREQLTCLRQPHHRRGYGRGDREPCRRSRPQWPLGQTGRPWPWVESVPSLCTIFFYFSFSFTIPEIHINF
jgi:hypothetical protein